MKLFFLSLQILIALGTMGLILLQSSKGGLTAGFGGGELYRTKRGAEKLVFWATILMTILFFSVSVANLYTS